MHGLVQVVPSVRIYPPFPLLLILLGLALCVAFMGSMPVSGCYQFVMLIVSIMRELVLTALRFWGEPRVLRDESDS